MKYYIYKITFPGMPWFYYGYHKKTDKKYFGSPKTNKWIWNFYECEVQILEWFDTMEEAIDVENRIIKYFIRDKKDPNCLNCHYGGYFPKWARDKGRTISNSKFSQKRVDAGKKLAKINIELGRQSEFGRLGGKSRAGKPRNISDELKLEKANQIKNVRSQASCSKGGVNASKIKYMCLETGYVSTAPGLSNYQRKRNIDTKKRKKLN